ncbi:MAG: thiamine-phosphate kinase [Prevotellaceae bacterium]|jgi:thiamine-monophosphate kinase|nr:thiamine-phosphate kinase [Prevotellaceae bacterium]
MNKTKRTPISELGEFGLIDRIAKDIKIRNASTEHGIGDDATVLSYGKKKTIVSTDLLLEGIHFDLVYTPLRHLGYKTAVVNFSDIYAMNAEPKQLLVSIGVSGRFAVEDIDELYAGIKTACEVYGVDLVGGDTSASMTGLTVSATVIGEGEEGKLTYRSGAKPKELICLTGNLGAAYLGLQLLEREKRVFAGNDNVQPQLDGYSYVLGRQLKPEARKDTIQLLKENNIVPTSMIDISDGLSSEVLHICRQSNVGARIYLNKIPIASETFKLAEEMNIDAATAALNGGEDYELLFTLPLSLCEKVKDLGGIDIIGHIEEESKDIYLIAPDGEEIPLKAQGWRL